MIILHDLNDRRSGLQSTDGLQGTLVSSESNGLNRSIVTVDRSYVIKERLSGGAESSLPCTYFSEWIDKMTVAQSCASISMMIAVALLISAFVGSIIVAAATTGTTQFIAIGIAGSIAISWLALRVLAKCFS